LENAIYRILQESLTNARRYSQSERVLVRLIQGDRYIRIEVQDSGIGFNPREVGYGHFGLEGIQERARLFGGSATIKSALGKGTGIVVQLPILGLNADPVDRHAVSLGLGQRPESGGLGELIL
jgi:signal transduction histidine kinase